MHKEIIKRRKRKMRDEWGYEKERKGKIKMTVHDDKDTMMMKRKTKDE